jgi:hypothetical protein
MTTPVSKLKIQLAPRREDAHDGADRAVSLPREALRPLHRREIDRRLEQLAGEVASALLPEASIAERGPRPRPRWVDTKAFVEQMRPFLVYN